MQKNNFKRKLKRLANRLLYRVHERDVAIVLSRKDTLLTVTFEFSENDVFFYFFAKTSSWDGDGDRTDMNDMFSTLPALFLRVNRPQISCLLLDVDHPLGGEIFDNEVYARYILLNQPHNGGLLSLSEGSLSAIQEILEAVTVYEMTLHSFIMSDPDPVSDFSYRDDDLRTWAGVVAYWLGEELDIEENSFIKRLNPHWYYFRSFTSGISVFHAPVTASALNLMLGELSPWQRLDELGYCLFKSAFSQNAAIQENAEQLTRLLGKLEGTRDEINLVPIDNRLIAVGKEHILFKECDCSRRIYGEGREKILERQRTERDFIFDGCMYEWAKAISGDRFEELVCELLRRKPGIVQVRQPSLTNEPDGNADLLCVWDTNDLSDMPQEEGRALMKRRKIVVQCKAWATNIGKSDIPNIRDTLDRHDADGMLIVSSKRVARSLSEHLEALRRKGIWADYWTRSEIEGMLDIHPDLVAKYQDVVWYGNPNIS